MKRLLILAGLLAALALVFGGCSSSSTPEEQSAVDFGAYSATDEEPNFGDPNIAELASEAEETPVIDAALAPFIDSLEVLPNPDVYRLRVVWGNLERDSGVTELTDWSGTLAVGRGGIIITHTIRFEIGQDYVEPYMSAFPAEVSWVSKTSWHYDGIAARVVIPLSYTDDLVLLNYESPQLSFTIPVEGLEDLDTLINIGFGNAIYFQAQRCDPNDHARGSLAGRWGRDEEGNGIFYGRWMSAGGALVGTIQGEWGHDAEGRPEFVGKYIDNAGNFEGFVRGTWRIRGNGDNATGQFRGRVYNAEREPVGLLHGHFKRGDTRKGGYFAGKWCVGCPNSMRDEQM